MMDLRAAIEQKSFQEFQNEFNAEHKYGPNLALEAR